MYMYADINKSSSGPFLVVQWLKLCSTNAGGLGSIPDQGTRSHVPQMGVQKLQPEKIPCATRWIKDAHAAAGIWWSQKNQINILLKSSPLKHGTGISERNKMSINMGLL